MKWRFLSRCFTVVVAVFSITGASLLPVSSKAQGRTIVATGTITGLTSPVKGVTNGSPVTITINFDPNNATVLLAEPEVGSYNWGWTNTIYETVNGQTTTVAGFIISLNAYDLDPNQGSADSLVINFGTNGDGAGIYIYYPLGTFSLFPNASNLKSLLAQGLTGSYAGDAVIWVTPDGPEAQLNTFALNPGPALGLSQSGHNLVVSVPTNLPPGFTLESSAGPLGANASWSSVALPQVNNTISIPLTNSSAFFRLRSTN